MFFRKGHGIRKRVKEIRAESETRGRGSFRDNAEQKNDVYVEKEKKEGTRSG